MRTVRTITHTQHTGIIYLRISRVNGININEKHIIKKKHNICLRHTYVIILLQRYCLRHEIQLISNTIVTNCNILSCRALYLSKVSNNKNR